MFTCTGFKDHAFCGAVAIWYAKWSDRSMFVCKDHVEQAQWNHYNDHSYDATGIEWEGADGAYEYEQLRNVPLKGVDDDND